MSDVREGTTALLTIAHTLCQQREGVCSCRGSACEVPWRDTLAIQEALTNAHFVTIPRAQYEALRAAAKALANKQKQALQVPNCTCAACTALAALRAAGIPEGK